MPMSRYRLELREPWSGAQFLEIADLGVVEVVGQGGFAVGGARTGALEVVALAVPADRFTPRPERIPASGYTLRLLS